MSLNSWDKKAINDLIGGIDEMTGHYYCSLCNKRYSKKGFLVNHIRKHHKVHWVRAGLKIKKEWEKSGQEMIEKQAIKYGRNYFEYLLRSIDDLKLEVERYQRNYEADLKEEPYAGLRGELNKRKKKNTVDEIGYCIHHVGANFQSHEHDGVIAIKALMSAFKFEF